jgi:glycosyltransferase involved in cell wall biosynthesis
LVLLPTYNNIGTLPAALGDVAKHGLPMMVVDDGCTDGTGTWLAGWKSSDAHDATAMRTVVTHMINQGKAAAMLSGFRAAHEMGFTHALTFDTDGQLDPNEIPRLLELAERHPDALIVGARNDRAADYPARSRLGRRISNLMIRWQCGVHVDDSQCGFRVYPLRLFEFVRPRSGRYAFETEIITLASWAGFKLISTTVTCRYFGEAKLVSHFRVGRETRQAIRLHARLLWLRLTGQKSTIARLDRPSEAR